MFFDPLYFLFLAPGILLALWAQMRVHSAYQEASQIPARSGLSGAQAAVQSRRLNCPPGKPGCHTIQWPAARTSATSTNPASPVAHLLMRSLPH